MKRKWIGMALALVLALPAVQVSAANGMNVKTRIQHVQGGVGERRQQPSFERYGSVPGLQTIVNADGSISVMSATETYGTAMAPLYVYEFDASGRPLRTLSFVRELPMVGAFARDDEGNYYIFYGERTNDENASAQNMVLVKYTANGAKVASFTARAKDGDGFASVKVPFDFGSCRMEVSGDLVAVYFARLMFKGSDGLNHQASYGFILDKNTMTRTAGVPYSSHSFNQFILPVADGFMFVDHGDAYPRAFMLSHVTKTSIKSVNLLAFRGGIGDNNTDAEMGGLAETSTGYLFAGTYEKDGDDVRNLFLVTADRGLGSVSNPIWLTQYGKTGTSMSGALSPKLVQIANNRYLVMWSHEDRTGSGPYTSYVPSTYYAIVDGNGTVLKGATKLDEVRLTPNDVLRYNEKTGLVHWAVTAGSSGEHMMLYSFDPNASAVPAQGLQSASAWAEPTITQAMYAELVPASLQGNYAANLTRGEFCRIAVQYVEVVTGLSAEEYLAQKNIQVNRNAFTDTNDRDILVANAIGVAGGVGGGKFNPNGLLTREQVAVMVANTKIALGASADVRTTTLSFADSASASDWAKFGIAYVVQYDIMGGTGQNRFSPKGMYTREQAIATFYNALLTAE